MEGGLNGDRHSKRVSRISTHRTSAAALGLPPRESVEQSYTTIWSDANLPGQDPEKINQVNRRWRDNNFFVRRGGWKRLLLLLLIIVIIIIGVVVGLVFGLRSHHSK